VTREKHIFATLNAKCTILSFRSRRFLAAFLPRTNSFVSKSHPTLLDNWIRLELEQLEKLDGQLIASAIDRSRSCSFISFTRTSRASSANWVKRWFGWLQRHTLIADHYSQPNIERIRDREIWFSTWTRSGRGKKLLIAREAYERPCDYLPLPQRRARSGNNASAIESQSRTNERTVGCFLHAHDIAFAIDGGVVTRRLTTLKFYR